MNTKLITLALGASLAGASALATAGDFKFRGFENQRDGRGDFHERHFDGPRDWGRVEHHHPRHWNPHWRHHWKHHHHDYWGGHWAPRYYEREVYRPHWSSFEDSYGGYSNSSITVILRGDLN